MEGDAGSGRLNRTPPNPTVRDDSDGRESEEPVDQAPPPAEAAEDGQGSDVEQTVVAETESAPDAADADTVGAPQSRLAGRRWLAVACAFLVLVAGGLATGGYFALRAHQSSMASTRAEAAALAAAKDCVTATQAPDATAMAASQQKIVDCSTGDFGAQAVLYSGILVEAYQAADVKVQVTDMRAAVERHNPDGSMEILVALRTKVSNSATQDQEQGYRLRVQMAPDQGTYKIARLDQVSK